MTMFAARVDENISTESLLRALVARGFRFVDPRDDDGDVVAVIGVRAHHDVVDVVKLLDEDDAIASRLPGDEDVAAPRRVFWQERGPAREVLATMLALPDERLPGTLVISRSA